MSLFWRSCGVSHPGPSVNALDDYRLSPFEFLRLTPHKWTKKASVATQVLARAAGHGT